MMRCKLLGVLALAAVVALPRPGLAGGGMSKALPQAASGLGNSTRNLAARNSVRNLASSGRPGDGSTRATMASQLSTLKRGPQTEAAAPAVKESALKEAVAPAAPVARSGGEAAPSTAPRSSTATIPRSNSAVRRSVKEAYPEVVSTYEAIPKTSQKQYEPLIDKAKQYKPGELGKKENKAVAKELLEDFHKAGFDVKAEINQEMAQLETEQQLKAADQGTPANKLQAVLRGKAIANLKARLVEGETLRGLYVDVETKEMPRWQEALAAQGVPKEQQAQLAHMFREAVKVFVRDLMTDTNASEFLSRRDEAVYGNRNGPTFEKLFAKELATGKSPEAAYDAIIKSSQRSNPEVNKALLDKQPKGNDSE